MVDHDQLEGQSQIKYRTSKISKLQILVLCLIGFEGPAPGLYSKIKAFATKTTIQSNHLKKIVVNCRLLYKFIVEIEIWLKCRGGGVLIVYSRGGCRKIRKRGRKKIQREPHTHNTNLIPQYGSKDSWLQ